MLEAIVIFGIWAAVIWVAIHATHIVAIIKIEKVRRMRRRSWRMSATRRNR